MKDNYLKFLFGMAVGGLTGLILIVVAQFWGTP